MAPGSSLPTTPVSRIGGYEIVSHLGSGGMGEVYRARDAKLNRDVAIKILPDAFAHDDQYVARFTREAQVLAALNHPNIAHIYGIVEAQADDGERPGGHVHALVMELVEGDDLSATIRRGPLPLDDAIFIARQIADALEAAHEHGIVHRDLKPANIKIRPDGAVKVLDFGLAKALEPSPDSRASAQNSPTFIGRTTHAGMILGTAAYMAPEQARGKPADRRADIWAFGVVLFEMLTGRRVFDGDDGSEVLASVLKTDPPWNALPPDTPPAVQRLLRRCLEKDPRRRLAAIGDARLELDEPDVPAPAATIAATASPVARLSRASRLWPAVAAALVTALVALVVVERFWPASPGPARVTRLSILAPPGTSLFPDSTGVAISPDGTMVAFLVGSVAESTSELWIRPLDSVVARRLDTGAAPALPFWSPDSRQIGFFGTDGKLRTIAASGGRAQVLCDAPGGRGAAWTPSNDILFAPDAGGPLYRISANGGTPVAVTKLDAARKEYGHRFPTLLPDGRHFLYVSLPGRNGRFDVFAGSLAGDSRVFIGSFEAAPVYADPGWLLSMRQGVLTAQRFNPETLKIAGDPVPLDDEPSSILEPATSFTAGRPVSIARSGALAYFSSPSQNTTADWYDASGRKVGTLNVPPGHYAWVRVSPDGRHAVLVRSTSPSESTLWLVDLARGGALPLSSGPGRNDYPVWSPDGARIAFSADRDGPQDIFVKNVFDNSPEQPLFRSRMPFKDPAAWSSDGKWLVINELDPLTKQNIWLLPSSGGDKLEPLVNGPLREEGGWPSPDGRWLAYTSDETGRTELFVQSFPVPGQKVQVSQEGAASAWWTRDGRQLVFVAADLRSLWRVDVKAGATLDTGAPTRMAFLPPDIIALDATPDRQRFLALGPERAGPGSITVVENWRAAAALGR